MINSNLFLEIINSFYSYKGFLIILKHDEQFELEQRINIPLKSEAICHCLGFSKNHIPEDILKSKRLKQKMFSKPNDFLLEMRKRLTKKTFYTLLNKFRSFILIFECILNNKSENIIIYTDVNFKTYKGDFCIVFNKNILVLEINTKKYGIDHIFYNCHIKSIRQLNNNNEFSRNQILKINKCNIHLTRKIIKK